MKKRAVKKCENIFSQPLILFMAFFPFIYFVDKWAHSPYPMGFICKCSMRLSCFVVFCCDIYIDSGRLKPKILPVGLILFLCERFFYTNDHFS